MFGVQYINLFVTCEAERKKREREDYKIADVISKEVNLQFCLFLYDTKKCVF